MYKIQNGNILRLSDSTVIPMDEGNSDYKGYLFWVECGGVVEPEVSVAEAKASADTKARELRDAELARADIMLNRVQDGETGIGTQKAWRAYRVSLRDWPSTESFPLDAPVAPDVKV